MFELQGLDKHGNWDANNVTWNHDATHFSTRAEAETEMAYWIGEGRDASTLRIVEVE